MASDLNNRASIFKGEGGANIVLRYNNSEKSNLVIRIRKTRQDDEIGTARASLSALEQETWQELFSAAEPSSLLAVDLIYITRIMAPLIGLQYIPPQDLMPLTVEESNLYGATEGVLMPDATLFMPPQPHTPPSPHTTATEDIACLPTVCIEIKPKCGFITLCRTVRPVDAPLKHSTSRYCLHQLLKTQQGEVDAASEYDPLDLFSGEPMRVEKALLALLNHPQNNFVLFLDGERIEPKDFDKGLATAATALFGHMDSLHENGDHKQRIAAVLRAIFEQESVLANIAVAQQACHYDIEGVYCLYCHLLDPTTSRDVSNVQKVEDSFCNVFSNDDQESPQRAAIESLLALPRDEALCVLRSYVISATAKDCSIMVAMRAEEVIKESNPQKGTTDDACGTLLASDSILLGEKVPSAELLSSKCAFKERDQGYGIKYKINVVDLDRKALSKIPKHLALDREIMAAAKQHRAQQSLD